ncbi:P-loop containing nucleoside triphosphate hydrolase protein [Geranomyces variabilis]|nr:P-loop containing nucleoside triphosphate hydrolase protein [Geranomyces variabilis]KAJ3141100.1 peroxisomal assembly protein [Geranomyces variabilis]
MKQAAFQVGHRQSWNASSHADIDVLLVTEQLWAELVQRGAKVVPRGKQGNDAPRLFVSAKFSREDCGDVGAPFGSQRRWNGVGSDSRILMFARRGTQHATTNYVHPDFFPRHGMSDLRAGDNLTVDLDATGFVELAEVILEAQNQVTREIALKDPCQIQNAISENITIMRQLGEFSLSLGTVNLQFRALTCLPVLQGTITSAARIIFSSRSDPHEALPANATHLDGPEISVEELLANGADQSSPSRVAFKALPVPLLLPVPEKMIYPRPHGKQDLSNALWTDYQTLARFGLFSGSMVTVGGGARGSRLCQIFGANLGQPSSEKAAFPCVYMSPSLLHNLGLSASTIISIDPATDINDASGYPIAQEITIARVAGRCTNDKKLLDECLVQLKHYLESHERVVCDGDIVSVLIDEERVHLKRILASEGVGQEEIEEELCCLGNDDRRKQVAYFQISAVSIDEADKQQSAISHGAVRIDPAMTKIVQAGILHTRVPQRQRNFLIRESVSLAPPNGVNNTYRDAKSLVSACLHPMSVSLGLACTFLIHGPRGVGKRSVFYSVAEELGIHLLEACRRRATPRHLCIADRFFLYVTQVNAYDILGDTDAKTEAFLQVHFDKAIATGPCILVLRHLDALAKKSTGTAEDGEEPPATAFLSNALEMVAESYKKTGHAVIVVGTTSDLDKVPVGMQSLFRQQVLCESPSEAMRLHVLSYLTHGVTLSPDVDLAALALQTAALVCRDLVDLVARAGQNARIRIKSDLESSGQNIADEDLNRAGIPVTSADFTKALDTLRSAYSDSIGAPKIPNVKWDDVGGLSHVKDNIYDTIQLPLERPELFATGMKKRSGILLYGPPGTGKTMVAKAVATNFALNFMSVKGPELLNMYIGESEANVRRVFQRARDARPCVVFFDELDSVAPKRGEKGDSGGVMDRIVSQLLAEIDGMGGGSDVFVIGATNRPDLLDPALLRPGRFDKLLYLGVSDTHDAQLNILQALTRKFRLHPDLDLRVIADACPFHYTGADFYALCSDAMLKAIIRTINNVDVKIAALNKSGPHKSHPHPITPPYYLEKLAEKDDTFVQVEAVDFQNALAELVPSVNPAELRRYQEIRKKFETEDKTKATKAAHKGKGPVQATSSPPLTELNAKEGPLQGDSGYQEQGASSSGEGSKKQHHQKQKNKGKAPLR